MADGNTVDSLEIEIEASSSKAIEKLTELTTALKNLREETNKGFGNVREKINGIVSGGGSPAAAKTRQRREALDRVAGASRTPTIDVSKASAQIENLDKKIEKANTNIAELNEQIRQLGFAHDKAQGAQAIAQLNDELSNEKSILDGLIEKRNRLSAAIAGQPIPTQPSTELVDTENSLQKKIGLLQRIKENINSVSSGAENLKSTLNNLPRPVEKLLSALKSIGGSGLSKIKSFGKYIYSSLTSPFQNAIKSVNKWKSAIGRIAFYRVIRGAIKMVTDGFKEGTDNLYQYSRIVGTEFAPAMDSLATSALYLRNSVGAMAAPLIQSVAPAVDFLVDKFVTLLNVIGKVFAALTGKSTYSQAIKYPKEYAESTKEASKALKDFTIGIDELNVINDSSSGGGGGVADYGSMFEEVEVPTEISDWAQKVKDAVAAGDWAGVGSIIATKLNEVVDGLDLAPWGAILGEKINNGLNVAYGFLTTFDFEALGYKIAAGANSLFDKVNFTLAGKTLAEKYNAVTEFFSGVVGEFDFKSFGLKISDAINGWFDSVDLAGRGKLISDALSGVLDTINSILGNTEWTEIGSKISSFFENIEWGELAQKISDGIINALNSITELLTGFNWESLGSNIAEFLNNIDWVGILSGLGTTISTALESALGLAVGFMENFDFSKFGKDLWNGLIGFITSFNWSGIVSKSFELLGTAVSGAVSLIAGFALGVWESIKNGFESTVSYFDTFIDEAGGNIIVGLFNGIINALASVGQWIVDNIFKPFIDGFKNAFGIHSPSTVMEEQGGFLIAGLLNGITGAWEGIVEFFGGVLEGLKTTLSQAWSSIQETASAAWEGIKTGLGTAWESIKTTAGEKFNGIRDRISTAWTNVKTTAGEKWESIKTDLGTAWEGIKTTAGTAFDGIKTTISNAWDSVKTTAATKLETIKTTISTKWGNIKSDATTWGKDLCSNLANGIRNGINSVGNAVTSVADKIKSILGFSEPEEGPLSNFHTFGPDMMELLAKGIRDNIHLVTDAVSSVASAISKSFNGIEYDPNTDYMALINEAIAAGDEAEAARLEAIRNAKIDGEGLSWAKTFDFSGYKGDLDSVTDSYSNAIDTVKTASNAIQSELFEISSAANNGLTESFDLTRDKLEDLSKRTKSSFMDMAQVSNGAIRSIVSALNSIPRNITTVHTIVNRSVSESAKSAAKAYASGGFPEMGQMFIAREAGPELVGTIGNKTAVANNAQIEAGIQAGVENANEEQNAILREQNELLRALLNKDTSVVIGNKAIKRAYDTATRQSGASIMAGGVMG